jgi:hypothetical protein
LGSNKTDKAGAKVVTGEEEKVWTGCSVSIYLLFFLALYPLTCRFGVHEIFIE